MEGDREQSEADSYSDGSFEELSSEEEKTPTFECNITPPSIGNSACGDSNHTMDNVHLQRFEEEENTAFDVSDIEDQPVQSLKESSAKDIYKGALDLSSELGQENLQNEELHSEEIIEINDEKNVIDDYELDKMDETILGLLQSTGQSPRVNSHIEPVYQSTAKVNREEYNCMQEVSPNMDGDHRSGRKRVRFASELDVFVVPFSLREFHEPYFEGTDDKLPDKVQSGSLLKSVNMDPYSQEFVDDLENMLNDIEEDFPEEPTLEDNNKEADVGPGTKRDCKGEHYCSRIRTSTVENSSSEAVSQKDLEIKTVTFPSEMCVIGAKEHQEYDLTDVLYYENENTPIKAARETDILEQNHKRGEDFLSEALLNHQIKSTRRYLVKNELSPPMTEETEELLPQHTETFFDEPHSQPDEGGSFSDVVLVPQVRKYQTANTGRGEGNDYNDQTTEEVEQECLKGLPLTKGDGAESPKKALFNKKKVTMVSNCYIDELIDNEIKRNIRGTTKTVNDRRSVIGHQHEAESTVNTDADFCWKDDSDRQHVGKPRASGRQKFQ